MAVLYVVITGHFTGILHLIVFFLVLITGRAITIMTMFFFIVFMITMGL